MQRLEVNLSTGEQVLVDLTPEEVADAQARTAAETTGNPAIVKQIALVETAQPITQRSIRELMLAIGQAFPEAQASVFYQKAAAQEVQVATLRSQLK